MRKFMEILWVLTPLSNTILCLLVIWRGWSGRLQWFTIWTGAAVAVDAIFWMMHATNHAMYTQLRVFVAYWLFNILMALVIFEAWRVRVRWLEYLVSIQLAMSLIALFAHRHGDPWTVYYLECFNVIFNLLGTWFCIVMLRGKPTYEPREARS